MSQNDLFVSKMREWVGVFMRNSMHNALRFSRESGWSMSQLSTLVIIHKRGTSAISDIGDELGVTKAAVSQLLDRMVGDGLLSRVEDPHDRRVKQIHLTEKGRRMLQDSLDARHGWINDLADALTDSEKEQIGQAIDILVSKAKQLAQDDHPDCSPSTSS